jgi:hypothetical protein
MTGERSVLRVTDADLEELRTRLRGTRWPRPWPPQGADGGWAAGTDVAELRRLARYWADEYDWRAREAAINALPGHIASLDGTGVFYLTVPGVELIRLARRDPGRPTRRNTSDARDDGSTAVTMTSSAVR